MTRNEALVEVKSLSKYEDWMLSLVNEIYDDFKQELKELENRSCDNCAFDYQCSIQDSIIQGHESKGLDISKDFIIKPFYCNRYLKIKDK